MKQSTGVPSLEHYQKGCGLETSQYSDFFMHRCRWTLLRSDPLDHVLVICTFVNHPTGSIMQKFISVLFLFLQIQYLQIYLHCPGVCGDICLHFHVSKAGGKSLFTNDF